MKKQHLKYDRKLQYMIDSARTGIGFILAWAFADKTFGLGFNTCADGNGGTEIMCDSAWLAGGSPTTGFLEFGVDGPFSALFNSMAGIAFVDWMFMLGLLLGGVALLFGIGIKIATVGASILFFMMWMAVFPTDTNPILSDHIIYIFVLMAALIANKSQIIGFGQLWRKTSLVKKYSILE